MTTTSSERRGPRLGFLIAGAITAVLAIGLLAAGGGALYADSQKDASGYLTTDDHGFSSNGSAIVTDNMDIDLDGAHWLVDSDQFGKVRLEVESDSSAEPVFVGIARTKDVDRYLRDVERTVVTDIEDGTFQDFSASTEERSGDRRPAPPVNQRFWKVSASGTGEQSVDWKIQDGDWSVVVMNADGSRGVHTDIEAGANLPWLDEAGWIVGGIGLLTLAGAIALILVGRPRNPSTPTPITPPAPAAA